MSFNLFNSVRIRKPKRNKFNLSHDVKLSCDMGQLIPFFCQDVLPGDTWRMNTEALVRFAPLIAPVMHRVNVYTHFFFVPKRLVWYGWKDFITGGQMKPGQKEPTTPPSYPRIRLKYDELTNVFKRVVSNGSLADYLGFPVLPIRDMKSGQSVVFDALPFRAYQLIWNEYYRDQNLEQELDILNYSEYDGIRDLIEWEASGLMDVRYRAWAKDYFTSALPWPQRGEDVELPLTGDADVVFNPHPSSTVDPDVQNPRFVSADGTPFYGSGAVNAKNDVSDPKITVGSSTGAAAYNPSGTLKADMSNVSAATIRELRRAIKAQEFLEVGATGGGRYIEQILAYFGVKSSDARLQRPEYLGGGKTPVVVSDVVQTSETTSSSPQANPSGNAVSYGKSNSFKRFFEEHGYIIGIMSVMPVASYQQGMPRQYMKFDRFDHYWPQFARIGEQEIFPSELFYTFNGEDGLASGLFGYAPRYAEYKFINSSVHGDFRDTLNFWHMGRIFESSPNLNSDFVRFKPGSADRVFAVQDAGYNHLWINIRNNVNALRPMPKYGTPMI